MLKPFKKVFKNVRIRKLIVSAVLAWSLFRGPRFASLDSSNQKQNNSVVDETVIKNELNNLEDSNTSGRIIETGTGTILAFQQEAYYANSNQEFNLLDQDDQQVILVKSDGNPLTPPTRGSGPSNLPTSGTAGRRMPHVNPYRMPSKVVNQGLGAAANPAGAGGGGENPEFDHTCSAQPRQKLNGESPTVNDPRFNDRKRKAKKKQLETINIEQEYKEFLKKIAEKGYTIDCLQDRFRDLATNPQTGQIDRKSVTEAVGALEGESLGMYTNLRRVENPNVDLDFQIDSKDGYRFLDPKTMIDFNSLKEQGKDITYFPSHEQVAYNMGAEIPKQKRRFLNKPGGPSPQSPDEVLHLINFDKIRNPSEKPGLINAVLQGAEDNGSALHINFINYEK